MQPWWHTYFDPGRYSVTLFDQRGCGHSRPLASEPDIDLSTITTQHLIGDVEALRRLHGVDRWLVFGGSWGSTLALAYAVEHPSRVSELVLWGVTTTTRHEVDWLTWSMGEIYPEAFAGLLALVPGLERGGNLPAAYNCLLTSHDADLRDHAARSWCACEERLATLHGSPTPSPRYADAAFRLGFARLVTHFMGQHAFLPPDGISGRTDRIADIPGGVRSWPARHCVAARCGLAPRTTAPACHPACSRRRRPRRSEYRNGQPGGSGNRRDRLGSSPF